MQILSRCCLPCRRSWLSGFLLLLAGLLALPAHAGEGAQSKAFVLDTILPHVEVGGMLSYLEDPDGKLDIQSVMDPAMADHWQPPQGYLRSRGYTHSAFWFRLRVRNGMNMPVPWLFAINQPDIENIEFHVLRQGIPTEYWRTGTDQVFSNRPVFHRNFIFPLVMQANEELEVVFRVRTDGPMLVPADITDQATFTQREQRILLILGLILGSMLVLAFYHAYMYLSAGGLRHLLLGMYVFSLWFFVLSVKGVAYQFLWPESIEFNSQSIRFFSWMSILWGVSYLLEFFEVRVRHPRLIWGIIVLLVIFSLLYMGSMVWDTDLDFGIALRGFHVLAFVVYLALAARLWWRGTTAERYLGLSLFAMFSAGVAFMLYVTGEVDYSDLAAGSIDYGLALSTAFLTLSLAEQIRQERIHQEIAFHRMLSQESELRAVREDALYQQKKENQQLIKQVRTRTAELSLVMEHLKESHSRLEDISQVDGLTGLHNLRSFRELTKVSCEHMQQAAQQVSLLIIDIDDFRAFNETHGHVMGDEVLRVMATLLCAIATRPSDIMARCGGEEFAVLLPDTDLEGGMVVAERIRRIVADHDFQMDPSGEPMQVSVSIGVAALLPDDASAAEMLANQARLALKRAKQLGKNQVSFFEFRHAGMEGS